MKEEFNLNKWIKEGEEIDAKVKKFQELLKIVNDNLENDKKNSKIKEETISAVDEGLKKIIKQIEPKVEEMLEKISKFERVKKLQQTIWSIISVVLILVASILFYKVVLNIYY